MSLQTESPARGKCKSISYHSANSDNSDAFQGR
jgi:hypothetical protein